MKDNKAYSEKNASAPVAFVLVLLCLALTCFIVRDCEKYSESTVSAAITYTPPQKTTDVGVWDIFSEAVASLLKWE